MLFWSRRNLYHWTLQTHDQESHRIFPLLLSCHDSSANIVSGVSLPHQDLVSEFLYIIVDPAEDLSLFSFLFLFPCPALPYTTHPTHSAAGSLLTLFPRLRIRLQKRRSTYLSTSTNTIQLPSVNTKSLGRQYHRTTDIEHCQSNIPELVRKTKHTTTTTNYSSPPAR